MVLLCPVRLRATARVAPTPKSFDILVGGGALDALVRCRKRQKEGTRPSPTLYVISILHLKKENRTLSCAVCVGVTYLPGQSPAKYCRRK